VFYKPKFMSKIEKFAPYFAGGLIGLVAWSAQAQTYRWKDEKGITHYGDAVPARYKDQAQVELSRDGIPLKRTDRALTAEERKALEEKRAADMLEAEKREAVDRLDRALMSKYANSRELDVAHLRELERADDELGAFTSRASDLSARAFDLLKLPSRSRDQRTQLSQLENDLNQIAEILERKLTDRRNTESRQRLERSRFEELMGRSSPKKK
jgi:hypothetical protein